MEVFRKNKFLLPAVIVVIIIVATGGAFFLVKSQKTTKTSPSSTQNSIQIKTLKADDIGLTLAPEPDHQTIKMTISKLDGISTIEYDVSYDARVTDSGEGNGGIISGGVTNSPIQVKSSDSTITREVYMGTCSRNVCKPDKVVGDVTFDIKVTYKDGTVGSVEQKVTP